MAVSKKTAAAAKATSKTDVAGRRAKKKGEPEFANYAEKAIPTRIQEFADWLTRETGEEVDARSVYLGSALRGAFQKSDENQERIAARAIEVEQEKEARKAKAAEREANKEQRAADRKAKAEAAAEAKKAKAAEPKKVATKKAAAKPAAKKVAAKGKAAPATTRRRPAKAAATDGDF